MFVSSLFNSTCFVFCSQTFLVVLAAVGYLRTHVPNATTLCCLKDGDCVITDFGFVDVERLLVVVRFVLCAFKFSLLKVYSQYLSSHFLLHLFSCYDYCHSNMERIHFKYCIRKYLIHLRSSVVASVYKFVYKNSVEMRVFK